MLGRIAKLASWALTRSTARAAVASRSAAAMPGLSHTAATRYERASP